MRLSVMCVHVCVPVCVYMCVIILTVHNLLDPKFR